MTTLLQSKRSAYVQPPSLSDGYKMRQQVPAFFYAQIIYLMVHPLGPDSCFVLSQEDFQLRFYDVKKFLPGIEGLAV